MIRRWLALTYYLYALRLAALSHFYFNRLYYSHQIATCGGWYRGTEMRLISLDGCGNFYGLHCSGEVRFYKHADKSSTTLAKSEKEFLAGIREIESQTVSMPDSR